MVVTSILLTLLAGLMAQLIKNNAPQEVIDGLQTAYNEIAKVQAMLVAKSHADSISSAPKW